MRTGLLGGVGLPGSSGRVALLYPPGALPQISTLLHNIGAETSRLACFVQPSPGCIALVLTAFVTIPHGTASAGWGYFVMSLPREYKNIDNLRPDKCRGEENITGTSSRSTRGSVFSGRCYVILRWGSSRCAGSGLVRVLVLH